MNISRRRRIINKRAVCCYRPSTNPEKQEEYQHTVPTSSVELNFEGEKLQVNIDQIDYIRRLTDGECGPLFIANMKAQSNIQLIVQKLSLQLADINPICPVDLATLESLNAKNCSYIIGYYGAILDTDPCPSELTLCMEYMDASMDRFYSTMHSLDNLTNAIEWKYILCRLINSVASALNFLANNGTDYRLLKPATILVNKQVVFKLCDVCVTHKATNKESCAMIDINYYSAALLLHDAKYDVHPDMWIFGISLLEIIIGQYPLPEKNPFAWLRSIQTWTPTFPSNQINLEEIQEIIIKLLKLDRQEQPQHFTEILEIPCIKDVPDKATSAEIDFVSRVINNIPIDSD